MTRDQISKSSKRSSPMMWEGSISGLLLQAATECWRPRIAGLLNRRNSTATNSRIADSISY